LDFNGFAAGGVEVSENKPLASGLSSKEPEPSLRAALERHLAGEEKSGPRVVLRFVRCSTRLSDNINAAGAYKALLDQCRAARIILNDDIQSIDDRYSQIKVLSLTMISNRSTTAIRKSKSATAKTAARLSKSNTRNETKP
jgi:hypothetical protein